VFVHAGTGTVFLDEIAELSAATQAKLLRAIEQKEIMPVGANEPVRAEARILAATNKALWKQVEQGRFREDLFYRLNVVAIDLPPDLAPQESDPSAVDELGEAVKRFERQHIERLLRQTPDKKEAARRLGMGLSSLYRRIGELGIQAG